MIEYLMTAKSAKYGLSYLMLVLLQAGTAQMSYVQNLFDKAVSLGLLAIGIIVIFKLFREGQKYNEQRDKEYVSIIQKQTEITERVSTVLDKNSEIMQQVLNKIDNLGR